MLSTFFDSHVLSLLPCLAVLNIINLSFCSLCINKYWLVLDFHQYIRALRLDSIYFVPEVLSTYLGLLSST